MRKTVISFISLAAAALALLSCAKEASIKDSIKVPKGITVNVIAEDASTRTAVEDGEIPVVKWLDTDKINLFEIVDDEIKGRAESAGAYILDGKADFSTTLGWEASGTSYKYLAVYPSSCVSETSAHYYVYLPEEQYLNGNNFSDNSDILISTVYDHGASRVEDGQPLMFSFYRLGTVVRLNLIGLAAGEKINKIIFSGPDGLTGFVDLDPLTGTIDPTSQYLISNSITLHLDEYESSGSGDPIWFRVLPVRNWGAGEEICVEVWTDKDIYKKEITLTSNLEFPDGGLTKLGVDISSSALPPVAVPCLWDFESGTADYWTFIDNDGDGNNWSVWSSQASNVHSGDYCLVSESYINDFGALTPDNWAFTPKIQLTEGNYLSFWVAAQDLNYPSEHYAVYIAKGSPAGEITELIPETEYPGGDYVETGDDGYQHHIIQIPAEFDNEIVCIGFRHFNCTDWFRFNVDDVSVTEENPYVPPTASYEDFLGYWATSTEEVFSITEKEDGVSYNVSGFRDQDYPVEALFEGNTLVIYDQVVYSDGSNEVALQGLYPSDGYLNWYDYPVGEDRILIVAVYDEEQDVLNIMPKNSYTHFIWLNYIDQQFDSYGTYATLPDVLYPYVPESTIEHFRDGFENGLDGWTLFDADGDGHNWELLETSQYSHSGNYCLEGDSYISGTGALDPDNYAYTPAITLTSNNYLRFWVLSYSGSWPEHFGVFITTSAPAASIDDCEQIYDGTSGDGEYEKVEVAIPSAYDGQTVYICFRHFDSSDNWRFFLDDILVFESLDDPSGSPAPAPKVAPKSFGGKYSLPIMRKDRRPVRKGIPVPGLTEIKK